MRRSANPPARLLVAAAGALALLLVMGVMAMWSSAAAAPGAVQPSAVPSATPTLFVTAPSLPPAPKATKAARPKRSKPLTLAQLRAEVERTDAELATLSAAWERGQRDLVQSRRRLSALQAEALGARVIADRAHDDLGRYAAAAYRGQQVPTDLAVLMAPAGGARDTLRALQTLEQTGSIKSDIAAFATASAARAQILAAQADTLTAQQAQATAQLAAQRSVIGATARSTQRALTAEVRRIALAKVRARNATCLQKAAVAAAFPNGLIPLQTLCSIGVGNHLLRGDAAIAFGKLAVAFRKHFARPMCVTSSYRNRELQAKLFAVDPVMVALPGRSHHGLGIAVDFCGGIQSFGSPEHRWMKQHAADAGWYHPDWAEPAGVTPEPWHWEFRVPD